MVWYKSNKKKLDTQFKHNILANGIYCAEMFLFIWDK